MDLAGDGPRIAELVTTKTELLVERLRQIAPSDLRLDSRLPTWSRATVLCHLRYGAVALTQMTEDTIAGREAAFYPDGRDRQRPLTLELSNGERLDRLVESLAFASSGLAAVWSTLSPAQWDASIHEPPDNLDLGDLTLAELGLMRLTEIEVHGVDLDIGMTSLDWSPELVRLGLAHRMSLLAERRRRHPSVDRSVIGRWRLRSGDGTTFVVVVDADGARVEDDDSPDVDVSITGTKAELFAFVLGRWAAHELEVDGDEALAVAFKRAFPGP